MKCAQCKIDDELLIQGLCGRCAGTKNSEGSDGWCCECAAERDEDWAKTWNHTNDGVTCPECTFTSLKKLMVPCKECSKDVRKTKLDEDGICTTCNQDKKMKAKVVCKICNVIHDDEERFVADLCNDCLRSELKESKTNNNNNNNNNNSNGSSSSSRSSNSQAHLSATPRFATAAGHGTQSGAAVVPTATGSSTPTTSGTRSAAAAAAAATRVVTPERYPLIGKRVAIEFDMVTTDPDVILFTQLYFGTVKRPIFNAGNRVTAYYVLFDGYNEDYEDESLYYSAPNIRKGLHQYEKLKDLDPARRDVESSEAEDENPTSTATTTMQPARTKRTHYPELIDAAIKRLEKNRTPAKLKAIQDSVLRSRRDLAGLNAELSKDRIVTALDMGVKNFRYSLKNGRIYEMYEPSKKRKRSSV